jgi:hypothetical protein
MQKGKAMQKVEKLKCGAPTKKGAPCKNGQMANGRCRMHNGNAKRGIDHHLYKHGRYSNHLPGRLADTYEAALADPDRLKLDEDIALTKMRIVDLLRRVDTGESGRLWKEIKKAMKAYRKALISSASVEEVNYRMSELESLINRGLADFAAYEEIGKQTDRHARLISTEMKRQQTNAEMMAITQVTLLFVAFANDIRNDIARHTQGKTRTRILADAARTADRYLYAGAGDIQAS